MMGTAMDPEDHPSNNMPTATQHYAGDVIPISSGRVEQYPGQRGVINSTGDIAQHLNNSRTSSDRTNVVPLKINPSK